MTDSPTSKTLVERLRAKMKGQNVGVTAHLFEAAAAEIERLQGLLCKRCGGTCQVETGIIEQGQREYIACNHVVADEPRGLQEAVGRLSAAMGSPAVHWNSDTGSIQGAVVDEATRRLSEPPSETERLRALIRRVVEWEPAFPVEASLLDELHEAAGLPPTKEGIR